MSGAKHPMTEVGRQAGAAKACLFAVALLPFQPLSGALATATSTPVGFATVTLPANSDCIVSVPFQRAAAFIGVVLSASGSTLGVDGAPGWTTDQFVYHAGTQPNTYFAFIRSGAKEGHSYAIAGNAGASLALTLGSDSLSGIAAGDSVAIIPYWTLGTVFPASSIGVQLAETPATGAEGTRVLVLPFPSASINPAPAASCVFSGGAWRAVGQLTGPVHDDDIVRSDTFLVIRNPGTTRTLVTAGMVVMQKSTLLLSAQASTPTDNPAVPPRPVPVTLNDSGLIASGAFATSTSAVQRADMLVVFDNTVAAINPPAAAFYFYYNSGWRKIGQPLTQDFGADIVIGPGKAAFVRKAAGASGGAVAWINAPTYPP